MGNATVLICDDNYTVHESLRSYLSADGISVVSVYDGETALQILKTQRADLVVLDIMMPGMDGTEVCREIRRMSDVPIIMLSAKTAEDCRIAGLEIGADDYVTKPFSPRELSIKIRRILNRCIGSPVDKKLTIRELTVFPESYEVFVAGEKIQLTPKETRVLSYLVANAGKTVSRGQIMNAIWGYENYCDIRVVDTIVKRIRQKLPTDNVHFAISSIYGIGYELGETI